MCVHRRTPHAKIAAPLSINDNYTTFRPDLPPWWTLFAFITIHIGFQLRFHLQETPADKDYYIAAVVEYHPVVPDEEHKDAAKVAEENAQNYVTFIKKAINHVRFNVVLGFQ